MSLPRELMVAISLLTDSDYAVLSGFARHDGLLIDESRLNSAIEQAVDDRIAFAREFLDFASTILVTSVRNDDMAARNSLARTYYAAHHAIRAALLHRNRADEYDHRDAIKAFDDLVKTNPFLAEKLKDILETGSKPEETRRALLNLLDMRHAADYHGYGSRTPSTPPTDFKSEAQNAQNWVCLLIEKIEKYVFERRAGIIK